MQMVVDIFYLMNLNDIFEVPQKHVLDHLSCNVINGLNKGDCTNNIYDIEMKIWIYIPSLIFFISLFLFFISSDVRYLSSTFSKHSSARA